jgi:competence protein ComEA
MRRELRPTCRKPSRRVIHAALLFTLIACGLSIAPAFAQQAPAKEEKPIHPEFPAGDGRDATLRLCTKCHSANVILATGRDRDGWEAIISKMVTFGAVGTDEEFTQIADYLTASFPPVAVQQVNVNKATGAEIASALGISADDAKAIITYRDKSGSFKSLDDLKKVPGIDLKNLNARKDRILY